MVKRYDFLVFVVLLVVLAVSQQKSLGQTSNQTTTIRTRTGLVLVPVIVKDGKGQHIPNLSKDVFQVEEDGKPQAIASFEEVRASAAPVQRPKLPANVYTNEILGADSPKALTIIAVDLINTQFTDQKIARDAIIGYLAKSVKPNELIALLVIRPGDVKMIHDFTSDSSVLAAALQQVKGQLQAVNTSDQQAYTRRATQIGNSAEDETIALGVQSGAISNPATVQTVQALMTLNLATQEVARIQQGQATLATLEAFQHIANYYSAIPGRKSLIWVTDSFPFSIVNNGSGGDIPGIPKDLYEHTMQLLNQAQVSVYPVDVRGLVPPNVVERTGGQAQRAVVLDTSREGIMNRSAQLSSVAASASEDDPLSTLRSIADLTGGLPFYNNNDIADLLGRAAGDSSEYYLVGYYRTGKPKVGWHKLKVNVSERGAHVRARSGYFYTPALENPESARKLDEQSALVSPLNYRALPIAVNLLPLEGSGSKKKASFNILVAGDVATIDTEQNNHVDLDFIAIAIEPDGKQAGRISQNFRSDLKPEAVQQIRAHSLTYPGSFELPPGHYEIRVIVRDNLSGKMGSVTAPLEVK